MRLGEQCRPASCKQKIKTWIHCYAPEIQRGCFVTLFQLLQLLFLLQTQQSYRSRCSFIYLFIAYCNISLGVASANMCDRPPAQYRCIRELWKMFHCYFPELMLTSSNILFCFVSFESKTRTFSIYNSSSAHILVHAKIHDATHRYKLYRWMKLKPVIWGRLAIFSCCHYGQADHGTSPDPDTVLYGPEPTFNRFDLIGWRRWEASDRRRDEWAVHGEKTETDQEWPGDNRGK